MKKEGVVATGKVMPVNGCCSPSALGLTLVHEHLFLDLRRTSFCPPPDTLTELVDAKVSAVPRSQLKQHGCSVVDNLFLDNLDTAVEEINRFSAAGGGTIVDPTPSGIGRNPEGLREVSRQTGVNIVMGCGRYCEISFDAEEVKKTEQQLEDEIVSELHYGVGHTKIRPGLIGEIGINGETRDLRRQVGEMTSAEKQSLRAAARASSRTGAPMAVHLPPRAAAVSMVIKELDEIGVPFDQVSLCHMDTIPDIKVHEDVIDLGMWIQYDCFGMDCENDWYSDVGDDTRCSWLLQHRESGRFNRVLVSHDVWSKSQLHRYGGGGYDLLPLKIVPKLRELGLDRADTEQLFVHGPAELLTWKEPTL